MNFFVVALLSALVGGTITWLLLRSREATVAERLRARDEDSTRLTAELATLRAESGKLMTLNAQLDTQLVQPRQHLARSCEQRLPRWCRLHAVPPPCQQRNADLRLQARDALAQC